MKECCGCRVNPGRESYSGLCYVCWSDNRRDTAYNLGVFRTSPYYVGYKASILQQLDSLFGSYARTLEMGTVTKMGTRKFPSVQVLSERPSSTGQVVKGKNGQGVIMADEPDVVYITSLPKDSPPWYGHWPIEETDLPATVRKQKRQETLERYVKSDDGRTYDTYTGQIVDPTEP